MNRRGFMGIAAGLADPALWGSAGCSAPGDHPTVLKMIATDFSDLEGNNPTQVYWDALIQKFEREHPGITVDVEVHSRGSAEEAVAELIRQGEILDIAQIGSFAQYAAAGQLYTADPPSTWRELRQAADALAAAGITIPFGLPLGEEDAHVEAMTWMLNNGGGIAEYDDYAIDAPANVQALNWLRVNLVGAGLTTANPAIADRQQLFDLFTRGEVGMVNGSSTLMGQADRRKFDYGVAPTPSNGRRVHRSMSDAQWIMAFKANGNREEIRAFLGYVYQAENHDRFVDRYGLLPVTTSATQRILAHGKDKRIRPLLRELETAELFPVGKPSWGLVSRDIRRSVGGSMMADTSPSSVLRRLQYEAVQASLQDTQN
ncbi:extracellular solute-binding protein [Streptomyces antimycoticus]|uniref:extracellular solute-binding protein n=1 Tax=Streptomyces antimycoticus TaxID=68175 RepID=UPI002570F0C5|nr:extracellular solute-binding protein [Streptomyces antimycoticus]WJE00828.1 extracellular solute-binding protein [Streptomyces antimycoticus]